MGKRKSLNEEDIRKKIRKLEKKLKRLPSKSPPILLEDLTPPRPHTPQQEPPHSPPTRVELEPDFEVENYTPAGVYKMPTLKDDQLPAEFLLALGKEGEEEEEHGEPIRPELALRWTKIMAEGLGKDARSTIIGKYPIPDNFPHAIAPMMNPEIMATLTEPSIKRDRRIVTRQNLTGKLLICLGRSLTNILKGNISSKMLIEEINDAAKIAADIHHEDSSSRKFFALAGATKIVQEAVKGAKIDTFLFGTDCADKIKAAQSIQKTSTQIADSKKPKPVPKKNLNWKGPPQNRPFQHQPPRGGQPRQQYRKPRYIQPRQTERKHPRARARHYR